MYVYVSQIGPLFSNFQNKHTTSCAHIVEPSTNTRWINQSSNSGVENQYPHLNHHINCPTYVPTLPSMYLG